jgi:2'-5' RNA ligase
LCLYWSISDPETKLESVYSGIGMQPHLTMEARNAEMRNAEMGNAEMGNAEMGNAEVRNFHISRSKLI